MTPVRHRNLSPWAQWQLALAALPAPERPPRDAAQLDGWRSSRREVLDELLGPWPAPVPPDVEILESVDAGAYRRDRIVFDSEATMSVPAFVLVPHEREGAPPATGIVAVHGHGPGKSEVCAVDTPEVAAAYAEHHGDYAHRLATAGHVVLAPDLRCFGERVDPWLDGKYPCDLDLVHAYIAGAVPLTSNVWDLRVALDVLAAHPLVDPARLGAVGFSYGATCALVLAAVDRRVRATVVSGFLSSWRAAHRVPANLCGNQVLPGMLGRLEHIDLAALVAPRALLVETGRDDPLFPLDAAREAVALAEPVFAALDARAAIEHHVFDGGHRWDGATVDAFLHRHLGRVDV